MATWVDDKLKKRQSDLTFQMKVILTKNDKFLEKHRRHMEEDRIRAAEVRTKELLLESARIRSGNKSEDSDDEELECMIDAFEEMEVIEDSDSDSDTDSQEKEA